MEFSYQYEFRMYDRSDCATPLRIVHKDFLDVKEAIAFANGMVVASSLVWVVEIYNMNKRFLTAFDLGQLCY